MNDQLVQKAQQFAKDALADKIRFGEDTFYDHCLRVVNILEKYNISDPTTLAAAILHDSMSDGAANYQDLTKEFGEEIALMVETLDGLRVIKISDSQKQQFMENLRKMFLVLARDLRIVLIKLCDILDNLQTMQFLPENRQKELSKEVLEIFAPLAERLGMGEMKSQMQDIAFKYLHPDQYGKVSKLLQANLPKTSKTILKIKGELKLALENEKIPCRIESRTKHLYSLFTKLQRSEINFDLSRIYDLIAFRIIVGSEEDCYKVLGLIHKLWKPIPNYVRDYIVHPCPNGYQSIHTTVFGPLNKPFEIQIRTEKMHEDAEYGIAAHWHYSEVKTQDISDEKLSKGVALDKKLHWVRQLGKWQEEIVDNEEFLKSIKTDLFGERIFIFTPKGDVKDLPTGSTPVDFAYSIHSDLGNLVCGAKVNNKMAPLNYQLSNGDVVEVTISKDKNKKPSKDWLKFVVTSEAKRRIKKVTSSLF